MTKQTQFKSIDEQIADLERQNNEIISKAMQEKNNKPKFNSIDDEIAFLEKENENILKGSSSDINNEIPTFNTKEEEISYLEKQNVLVKGQQLAKFQKEQDEASTFTPSFIQDYLPGPNKLQSLGREYIKGVARPFGGTETVAGLTAGATTLGGHLYDRFFNTQEPKKAEDQPVYNFLSTKKQKEDFKRRFDLAQSEYNKKLPWSDIMTDVKESMAEAMDSEESKNIASDIVSGKAGVIPNLAGEFLAFKGLAKGAGSISRALEKFSSTSSKGLSYVGQKVFKASPELAGAMGRYGAEAGAFTIPLAVGDNIKDLLREAVRDDPNYFKTGIDATGKTAAKVSSAMVLSMGLPAVASKFPNIGEKVGQAYEKFYTRAMETLTGVPRDVSKNFIDRTKQVEKLMEQMADDPGLIGPLNEIKDDVFSLLNHQRIYLNQAFSQSLKNTNQELLSTASETLGGQTAANNISSMRVIDLEPLKKKILKDIDNTFHKVLDKNSISFVKKNIIKLMTDVQNLGVKSKPATYSKLLDWTGRPMIKTEAVVAKPNLATPEELILLKQRVGDYLADFYENLRDRKLFIGSKKNLNLFLNDIYHTFDKTWNTLFPQSELKSINQAFTVLHKLESNLKKVYSERAALSRVGSIGKESSEAAYYLKKSQGHIKEILEQFDDLVGVDSIASERLKKLGANPDNIAQKIKDIYTAKFFHDTGPGSSFLPVDQTGKSYARIAFSQAFFGVLGLVGMPFKVTQLMAPFTTSPLMFKWGIKLNIFRKEMIEELASKLGVSAPTDEQSLNNFVSVFSSKAIDLIDQKSNNQEVQLENNQEGQ